MAKYAPTISLCIAARNEAAFIGPCIESALPVVDEVVVVDTGSTDDTAGIAERRGARVFHYPWPEHHARAFNFTLDHAQGEWILSLDADEVLDPGERALIPEIIRDTTCTGYMFTVRNYTHFPTVRWRRVDPLDPLAFGARGWTPSCTIRLFRNHPKHRYTGALHQRVLPSLLRRGGEIGHCDVPIHHYGPLRFDRSVSKSSRYLKLTKKELTAHPKDARARVELGEVLLSTGNWKKAQEMFREAHSLGYGAGAAFLLGRTLLMMGQPAEAIGHLEVAIQESAENRSIDFELADAWLELGAAHEALGRVQEAEDDYRRALTLRPDNPMAANNFAALLSQREALDEAAETLNRILPLYPGFDMLWATLGANRLRGEDFEGALEAFRTALDIDPENVPARMNLALTLKVTGETKESGRAYALAEEGFGMPAAFPEEPTSRVPAQRSGRNGAGLSPLGEGGVVSLIPAIAGGGGRVLVDAVLALQSRPQVVLCAAPGSYEGLQLRDDLDAVGIEVRTVTSTRQLRAALKRLRPAVVIHHWWASRFFPEPVRAGDEKWIAVGHAALPMPGGYDAYVVLSDFHAQFQGHLPQDRIRRIPDGVDRKRFASRRTGRRKRPLTIRTLSRLDPGKFPRRLLFHLPALGELRAQLLIAGRGPRRVEVEPEIEGSGLTGVVRFVGPIPSRDVPDFLRQADIGLHLNETHEEICSMTILEMLAAGLPIVAQPRGCIPEMVVDGKNGLLAQGEDQIAERLHELIRKPSLRRKMGEASRRRSARFDMRKFRSSYQQLVDELANAMGRAGRR